MTKFDGPRPKLAYDIHVQLKYSTSVCQMHQLARVDKKKVLTKCQHNKMSTLKRP